MRNASAITLTSIWDTKLHIVHKCILLHNVAVVPKINIATFSLYVSSKWAVFEQSNRIPLMTTQKCTMLHFLQSTDGAMSWLKHTCSHAYHNMRSTCNAIKAWWCDRAVQLSIMADLESILISNHSLTVDQWNMQQEHPLTWGQGQWWLSEHCWWYHSCPAHENPPNSSCRASSDPWC